MASIADLVQPFEGTPSAAIVPGGTIDDVYGGAPTYSSIRVVGNTSAQFSQVNNNSTCMFDIASPRNVVYYDFYLDMVTIPTGNFPLVQWQDALLIKGGDVRIQGSGTYFNFQIRNSAANTSMIITTWDLPAGQYRVQIKIDPESATGYSVKVFSGASINSTTPAYDTGTVSSVGSGITTVGRMQLGIIAAVAGTTTFRIDDVLADDASPVVRATATTGQYYKSSGVWIPYDYFYRQSGAWI